MRVDRPEHYYQVAQERIAQAEHLYNEGSSYALAMYVSGLAVESLIRAFKLRRDSTFDEKHDLERLFKASGMLDVEPAILAANGVLDRDSKNYVRELQSALTEVARIWLNSFRFASEARMRAYLKRSLLDRGIRGDYLKANCGLLLNAAKRFIRKGSQQWNSSKS